jgi:hypothetical protein
MAPPMPAITHRVFSRRILVGPIRLSAPPANAVTKVSHPNKVCSPFACSLWDSAATPGKLIEAISDTHGKNTARKAKPIATQYPMIRFR